MAARHIIAGAALLWSLSPVVASAIGFGKASVDSALGEPLSVRVPLVAVQPGELDELSIGLADATWYQVSGVEYPQIAPELNLSLDLSDVSAPAIEVTTRNGVDQVAIPLVLELQWPQRVMRRQVNVLLNPVGYQAFRAPLLPSTERDEATGSVSDLVEASGTTGAGEFVSPDARRTEQTRSGNANPDAGSAAATRIAATTADSSNGGADAPRPDFVTVRSGDTLSTIVDQFLPDGATRYQGRITFYDRNPDAFQGGDIHRIVRGATLEVPSSADILGWPAGDARDQYLSLADVSQQSENASTPIEASATAGESVPSTNGFRLSLLEVEEPQTGAGTATAPEDASQPETSRVAQSGTLSGEAQSQSVASASQANATVPAAAGADDFAMQGFSMKLTVMNAYIVELQDENRQLKARVENLEQKVEQLIRNSLQPGGAASLAAGGSSVNNEVDQRFFSEPADIELAPIEVQPEAAVDQGNGQIDNEQALAESSAGALPDSAESTEFSVEPSNDTAPFVPATEPADPDLSVATPGDESASGADVTDSPAVDQTTGSVAQEQDTAQAKVIPGSADGARSGDTEGIEAETVSPSLAYRDSLVQRGKALFERFNTPLAQLIAAVIGLGVALLLWMRLKDRRRYRLAEEFYEEEDSYDLEQGVGVSYENASEVTVLDLDDDPWVAQSELSEDQLEGLHDSDVDLITQSEVYLTYNRPVQAIEVLREEYAKKDSDKFIVASRILRIFEEMGQGAERNDLLRDFIVLLNNDIEEFSASEWDSLRIELNGLRRTEHLSAIEGGEEASAEVMTDELTSVRQETDQSGGDSRRGTAGFGVAESDGSVNGPDAGESEKDRTAAADERRSKATTRDDGVIELNYEPRDKARSN